MRLLWHADSRPPSDLDEDALADLYRFGSGPVLRANFVSTLDGAGTGPDHRSGSINTPADTHVFGLQRRLADAVLVGAGTARAEGYRRATRVDGDPPTMVVVSNSGRLPDGIRDERDGDGPAVLITCAAASGERLDQARVALGEDNVWTIGETAVDLTASVARLRAEGIRRILAEGGPTLFSGLLGADVVDEVALTLVPSLVGGDHTRITNGPGLGVALTGRHLCEADGALLGLWAVDRS
jgi:riboflavin biosynthesis pyrimidine reductase